LGWQPGIPVEQNVAEYVAWMGEQEGTHEYLQEAGWVDMVYNEPIYESMNNIIYPAPSLISLDPGQAVVISRV
jgi:hypothetical protein